MTMGSIKRPFRCGALGDATRRWSVVGPQIHDPMSSRPTALEEFQRRLHADTATPLPTATIKLPVRHAQELHEIAVLELRARMPVTRKIRHQYTGN